jgi:hypothetical protein
VGFFSSLIAYLGAVIGIVIALLLPLCVLFSIPGQPTTPQQTAAMASSLSEPAATTNTTIKVTSRIRRPKSRVAPRILYDWLNAANDTSRKRSLYMLARQRAHRQFGIPTEAQFCIALHGLCR